MVEFTHLKNSSVCQSLPFVLQAIDPVGVQANLSSWQLVIILIVFGVFTAFIAKLFKWMRTNIYNDKNNLDTAFDAGGQVSIWLTATTIVSQWTWAATLLQSSTVASKYGISGPFWYASGATIQILLFAMISIQLKIRAPGAKTFLQVIRARFGSSTHIVFCVFALLTNIIVTAMLMLGGTAVMTGLVDGLSVELATALVVAVMATYTFIGSLGATFYVSYFNTSVIFTIMLIFLVKVYHNDSSDNPLGSVSKMYELINCGKAVDNDEENYLTMLSNPGLMFGIINIIGNFGTVFVDQSYWQSSIAAKPREGIWGFLSGGLVWFAVPFTFATTMGLAYIGLSVREGGHLLTSDDVNAGLVAPIVAQKLMGQTGELLVLVLLLMAVMSTGSAEIIAVTSILVYDIYQLYLRPFRQVMNETDCVLCGSKSYGCTCVSMTHCQACKMDDTIRKNSQELPPPAYDCSVHGKYRSYTDYLSGLKDWCVVWVSISIIPLTLILNALSISLGWVYLFMGVVIGSAVVPISLSIFWERLTGKAMMAGSIIGTICGLISWLYTTSTFEGGFDDFINNSGKEESMLVGNCVSIGVGALVTIIVSFMTSKLKKGEGKAIWELTRDIDNPLSPWAEKYAADMEIVDADKLCNRPSFNEVNDTYKRAKIISIVGALLLTLILIIVWPAVTVTAKGFSEGEFKAWVGVSEAWGIIAAIFIIIMPLLYEGLSIRNAVRAKRNEPSHKNGNINTKAPEPWQTEHYGNGTSYTNPGFSKPNEEKDSVSTNF